MVKSIPAELEHHVLPFNWDVGRLWTLPCAVRDEHRARFDYLLDLPFWSSVPDAGMLFDLVPMTVIQDPASAPHHAERILSTDTSYPLEFLEYRDKCWILDGVHRLSRLYMSGVARVRIRIHDTSIIPGIRVC